MPPKIRLATFDDAEAIRAIYAPSVLESPASFELELPSVEEMRRRIATVLQSYPWVVYEDESDCVLGYAYASRHSERAAYAWSVNTTVYVDAGSHRRGVGRALYSSLLALLTLQGYYNAYGGITLPNDASVGLHKAMGYELVGVYRNVGFKFGAWHDVSYWGLELKPPSPDVQSPLPPSKIQGTPEWQRAMAGGLD